MAAQTFPLARNPAGPAPVRRPGSVRRTSTIETTWPEGYGKPMLMQGRARDLLTPSEQKLFRRISVFVGGCTLEAAEAVCDADEDLGADLLDAITSLVDKSLLSQTGPGDAEPRFILLETIREYGGERLQQSGELASVKRAHAAYCLILAEEGAADVAPAEREAWLDRCDAE